MKILGPAAFGAKDSAATMLIREGDAMQRAKRLLEGLRIHHLGFGFFWTVTFVALTGFQSNEVLAGPWIPYTLSQQILLPLAVSALGIFCARRHCELPYWTAPVASFMLSGGALLYFLAFHFGRSSDALAIFAGILLGTACALFFLLWELFYVTEGQQRALICIPLSAAMSVELYLLITLLPLELVVLVTVTVLPLVALVCLQKSLSEIEMDVVPCLARTSLARTVTDLWRPVLCVSILGFSWKLIGRVAGSGGDADTLAVLVGFAAAALLVVALELFLTRGFDILHICQLLFPTLTVVFLLPSLFGQQYTSLLVAFLMFGFEVVNLLLIITCAVYTVRHSLPSSPLYALCIAPVLLFMALGSEVGAALGPALSDDFAHWATPILLCVVLLSVALVLLTRGKGEVLASVTDAELLNNAAKRAARGLRSKRGAEQLTASNPATSHNGTAESHLRGDGMSQNTPNVANAVVEAYLEEHGLSPREREVAELLMKGHTVSAIAGKLYISENTTRGHSKSIYKKLGIHTRQELVDLGDQLTQTEHASSEQA